MKFLDNKGNEHDNFISALCKSSVNKMDDWVRGKMPGYEETINENEHLYDDIHQNFDSYQSEDDDIVVDGQVLISAQSEVPETMNAPVESYNSSEGAHNELDSYLGAMGVKFDLPTEKVNAQESSPDVKDLLKMDHEDPIPSLQKIDIDYAHGVINLKDANGEIIATSMIDQNLTKQPIDRALLDILYPDNNIPAEVSMDIQSKGYIPGHASKSYIEPITDVPEEQQSVSEEGFYG